MAKSSYDTFTDLVLPPDVLSPLSSRVKSRPFKRSYELANPPPDDLLLSSTIMEAKRTMQRERRRNNQKRYRQKQLDLSVNLEKETEYLRDEVKQLKRRRCEVMASVPTKDNVWSFAVEYFRLFRSGLRNTALRTPPAASQYNAKLSTMREAMVPDVVFNAGRGVEALLKNWMCVSLRLEDVEVELDEIKKGPADSLLASSTTSVTIQGRALRSVFPHLCVDDVDPPLARKLLGQRIHMNSWTRFEWDSTVGKVTSVTSTTDLLTPMLQLVGSVENVSRVFEGALISPNFEWRSCIDPPWRPQL